MGEGSKSNSFIFICFISITGELICTSHKWERAVNLTVFYSFALFPSRVNNYNVLVTSGRGEGIQQFIID